MAHLVEAEVMENRSVSQDACLLFLKAPEIAREVRPGQFLMAAVAVPYPVPSPLLKRALAVYSVVDGRQGPALVSVLVRTVGEGTGRLAAAEPGQRLNVIGPLGNGFDLQAAKGRTPLLLAGGVGIGSMYLLADSLAAQGERAELIYGAKTAADLALLDDFQRLGLSVWPVTDDGSLGFHGNVADKLADLLGDRRPEELSAYACGPEPMLRAVCALVNAAGVPCQISVEARLACGFGVCLGCTIRTRSSQRLVCTDGPVFAASEFVWED